MVLHHIRDQCRLHRNARCPFADGATLPGLQRAGLGLRSRQPARTRPFARAIITFFNGRKSWTTPAQIADWAFCLAVVSEEHLPGRMNHRAPRTEEGSVHPDPKVVFTDRHEVRFVADGVFATLFECSTICVNSLHGQAILEPGDRIVVEGVAEDGTIEAIRIADAPAFALGVQWHAEVDAHTNPVNRGPCSGVWSRATRTQTPSLRMLRRVAT